MTILPFVKRNEVLRSLSVMIGALLVAVGFLNISLMIAQLGNQILAGVVMTVSFTVTCLIAVDMID